MESCVDSSLPPSLPHHRLRLVKPINLTPKSPYFEKENSAFHPPLPPSLPPSRPPSLPKVNISNLAHIVPELFQENLVRGRGLFVRAVMKAQLASPGFTHIYAA